MEEPKTTYATYRVRDWTPGPDQPGIERYRISPLRAHSSSGLTRYRPRSTGDHWWDHAYTYIDKYQQRHYCTEPYFLSAKTLLMLGTLYAHGWEVSIGGMSRHGAGTVHVDIVRLREV